MEQKTQHVKADRLQDAIDTANAGGWQVTSIFVPEYTRPRDGRPLVDGSGKLVDQYVAEIFTLLLTKV